MCWLYRMCVSPETRMRVSPETRMRVSPETRMRVYMNMHMYTSYMWVDECVCVCVCVCVSHDALMHYRYVCEYT
jgi:hypothetical protein